MSTLEFAVVAFASIIAITEPTSTIPSFLSVTKSFTAKERQRLALKVTVISFALLAFFALTGHLLFVVFNISHAAFTIAGGLFLIYVAFGMFRNKKEDPSSDENEKAAVAPLAFPLTAGPGAITIVILLASRASNLVETSLLFVAIGAAMLVVYAGLFFSSKLATRLSNRFFDILPALISIFILAIGVQFIINGVTDAASSFP